MDKLKECPFCGGTDVSVEEGSTFRWAVAICNTCDAAAPEARAIHGDEKKTQEAALTEWNRRASPASVPEGWKLVPVEATKKMCGAAYSDRMVWNGGPRAIYETMLSAAPTPPVSEDRWLPIETAPKDKFVLLAGPSGYTTIEIVYATGRMCSDYHVGRWIDHANDDLTDWGFEPTHWRPLPKAPAMQEDKP